MAESSRIPRRFAALVAFLIRTDILQLTIITPPSTKRYTLWGWTDDFSSDWTDFRTEAESLYGQYTDEDQVTPVVRQKLKTLMLKVQKYDHDSIEGNRLLDRVALLGTVDDCATFNIKRSTTLAKTPIHGFGDPKTLMPRVALKEILKGMHVLDVDEPTLPDTKGRPKGVLAVLVFRYIGPEPPKSGKEYELVGAAIRGRFNSKISNGELSGSVKLYAYYYARYLTTTGILGEAGNVIIADVVV